MFLQLLLNGRHIIDLNNLCCAVYTCNLAPDCSSLTIHCIVVKKDHIKNGDIIDQSTISSAESFQLIQQAIKQMFDCLNQEIFLYGQPLQCENQTIIISLIGLRKLYEKLYLHKEHHKLIKLILQLNEFFTGKSAILRTLLINTLESNGEFIEYLEMKINDDQYNGFAITTSSNHFITIALKEALKKYMRDLMGPRIIIIEGLIPITKKNAISKHYLILSRDDFSVFRIKLFTEQKNAQNHLQLFSVANERTNVVKSNKIDNNSLMTMPPSLSLPIKFDFKSAVRQLDDLIFKQEVQSHDQKRKLLQLVEDIFFSIENLNDLCNLYKYIMHDDNKAKLDMRNHPWFDFFFATEFSDSFHDTLVKIRDNAFQKLLRLVGMTKTDVENILNGKNIYLNNIENIIFHLRQYIVEDLFCRHHAKHKGHISATRTVEIIGKIITYANEQMEKEDLKDKIDNSMFAL